MFVPAGLHGTPADFPSAASTAAPVILMPAARTRDLCPRCGEPAADPSSAPDALPPAPPSPGGGAAELAARLAFLLLIAGFESVQLRPNAAKWPPWQRRLTCLKGVV